MSVSCLIVLSSKLHNDTAICTFHAFSLVPRQLYLPQTCKGTHIAGNGHMGSQAVRRVSARCGQVRFWGASGGVAAAAAKILATPRTHPQILTQWPHHHRLLHSPCVTPCLPRLLQQMRDCSKKSDVCKRSASVWEGINMWSQKGEGAMALQQGRTWVASLRHLKAQRGAANAARARGEHVRRVHHIQVPAVRAALHAAYQRSCNKNMSASHQNAEVYLERMLSTHVIFVGIFLPLYVTGLPSW